MADSEMKECIDLIVAMSCVLVFSYESGCVSKYLRRPTLIRLESISMYVFLYHFVFISYIVPISDMVITDIEVKKTFCLLVVVIGTSLTSYITYKANRKLGKPE